MLPTDLAGSYADDPADPSTALHHQHHDVIHAMVNAFLPAVTRTSAEWEASDAVLETGQLGIASDTGEMRPGAGHLPWRRLPSPVDRKVDEGTLALDLRRQPGVVGDGVADDAAAITIAAVAAANLGLRLFATGSFRIGSTVRLICDADLSGATFIYHGSGVALQLGGASVLSRRTMVLPHVLCAGKPRTGWLAGTIGVKAVNLNTCTVTISRVTGFETGFLAYGQGSGTAYCTVNVGHLDNNKRNLVLGADATGWSNQNTFIGGRYSHNSSEGEDVPGTRHILLELAPNPVNNNLWLNPSVEGSTVEQQIDVSGGSYNQWINPRLERSSGGRLRWGAGANQNVVLGGYNAAAARVTRVTGESRNAIRSANLYELYGSSSVAVTRLQNTASDAKPALAIYGAGSVAEKDYRWGWSASSLEAKRTTDAFPRLILDGDNGRCYVGSGAAAPTAYLAAAGTTGLSVNGGHLYFGKDNLHDVGGKGSLRPRDVNVARNVAVGGALAVAGKVGFYGATPGTKPVVSGSREGNAALGSLIKALAQLGLVTDSTTL